MREIERNRKILDNVFGSECLNALIYNSFQLFKLLNNNINNNNNTSQSRTQLVNES